MKKKPVLTILLITSVGLLQSALAGPIEPKITDLLPMVKIARESGSFGSAVIRRDDQEKFNGRSSIFLENNTSDTKESGIYLNLGNNYTGKTISLSAGIKTAGENIR